MYADVFNKVNEALHVPINWDPRKSRENAVEVSQIRVVPINKTNIPRITVFTDGAATANGRANCRASYGYYITGAELDVRKADIVSNAEIRGEKYSSSNNRGELSAIYHATQYLVENIKGSDIEIVSDSQYSINCIEVWAHRWLADPVKHSLSEKKNMDIIKPTLDNIVVIQKSNVLSFKHIRSHKNAPLDKNSQEWFYWNGNDIADKLCTTVLKKNV
jgi:ribonuclease HI